MEHTAGLTKRKIVNQDSPYYIYPEKQLTEDQRLGRFHCRGKCMLFGSLFEQQHMDKMPKNDGALQKSGAESG